MYLGKPFINEDDKAIWLWGLGKKNLEVVKVYIPKKGMCLRFIMRS